MNDSDMTQVEAVLSRAQLAKSGHDLGEARRLYTQAAIQMESFLREITSRNDNSSVRQRSHLALNIVRAYKDAGEFKKAQDSADKFWFMGVLLEQHKSLLQEFAPKPHD